ncbi:MAG: MFS transporter [Bacteroidia bacterium]|nr:MFS transporter [Bacteroidia bacterium]
MYDWANSVYALTVTTAVFPSYFHDIIAPQVALNKEEMAAVLPGEKAVDAIVPFLGMEMKSVGLVSFCFALAYLFISVFSPILGGIADYSGHKKKFMIFFCTLGAGACCGLYFFTPENYVFGIWMFIMAAVGFAGGNIFNDAFLPEITTPEHYDRVSARGFSMGYIGSLILLAFNLLLIMKPEWFFEVEGLTQTEAVIKAIKFSFLTVGIWWFGFAQITFWTLKDVPPPYKPTRYLAHGFGELKKVLGQIRNLKNLRWYLTAFFAFNMGLQTVMYMAASFGSLEFHLKEEEMIILMFVINLIAVPGSILFAWLSRRYGNLKTLLGGICFWMVILVYGYFVESKIGFFCMGGAVGVVMGGMQALSRATYSKFLPETRDTASFFSFFSIMDKVSIVGGTATFGIFNEFFGTRNSILALELYFLVGGLIIFFLVRNHALRTGESE